MKSARAKTGFRILRRRKAFSGKLIHLDILRIRTESGRAYERELIRHPGAVIIIPRLGPDRLMLIRQLRIAAGGWIWEFPAGTLEKGESAFQCAARELREETGWKAGRLRKVLEFFPTPGMSTERMHLFIAEGLSPARFAERDADEELEVRVFSIETVQRMIRRREIIDGKTILGFLFLKERSKVR